MPAISAALKKAILELPAKEKDKLLLRLVGKNSILIEQLEFRLLEESLSTEWRRDLIKKQYEEVLSQKMVYSKELFQCFKTQIAAVTRHVKVCGDKYGEIELTLHMLLQTFEKKAQFLKQLNKNNDKLCHNIVRKTNSLLKKMEAIDDELRLDFMKNVEAVLEKIHQHATLFYALKYQLPQKYDF